MKKLLAFLAFGSSLYAMPPQANPMTQIHRANRTKSQNNQQVHGNRPSYQIFVLQPTPGYRTLSCVNWLFQNGQFSAGYGKIPENLWHISVMALKVPFVGA